MEKFRVTGGNCLHGEVEISGAKNAAVAILPAVVLAEDVCLIENLPNISDVALTLEILEALGATVRRISSSAVEIDPRTISSHRVPTHLANRMRASYYFLGSLLGRFGIAQVPMPGGCNFGVRPIDMHLLGFSALGANVAQLSAFGTRIKELSELGANKKDAAQLGKDIAAASSPSVGEMTEAYANISGLEQIVIEVSAEKLVGNFVDFKKVSVGATMNIMLAAVKTRGLTVINHAAREPHVVDLANFLNSIGADVRGAGTDTIKIRGVEHLRGTTYSVIPDQIEAGTYMAAAVATGGDALIKNVTPHHLKSITEQLQKMGVTVEEYDDAVYVSANGRLRACQVTTQPHPGFPTDMQPQIGALLSVADGTGILVEEVWDNRFRYIEELRRMGADVEVDGSVAVFKGVEQLTAAPVAAFDLRAGAAMIIAALTAKGTTEIENIHFIKRGYENIVEKLRALGAEITEVDV